jgi:hypothetical protein
MTSGTKPRLTYRLDGLMARVTDADALPVLLAVRDLSPRSAGGDDLYYAWQGSR